MVSLFYLNKYKASTILYYNKLSNFTMNALLSKLEKTIYSNILPQSRYISNINTVYETLIKNIIEFLFGNSTDDWDNYISSYFSHTKIEVFNIQLDKIYSDLFKHIFAERYFKVTFSDEYNPLLQLLSVEEVKQCLSVHIDKDEEETYHGSSLYSYKLRIDLNTPECISILSKHYNNIHHTQFDIDANGKLTSANMIIYRYICNDNFEDTKVNFDFTDYLSTLKHAVKQFNLLRGKLILKLC